MFTPTQYRMLHDLPIPNSYAVGLRAGDQITEQQRETGGLVVGKDVEPLDSDVMARPEDDADRAAWQNYAVVRGVPYDDAINLDRDQLIAREEVAATAPKPAPRKTATKADTAKSDTAKTDGKAGTGS